MRLYDRILSEMNTWAAANWYDGLSDMDRHDTDMAIGYGRDERWKQMATAQSMSRIRADISKAVVFDVSNVAAYVAQNGFSANDIPAWNSPYEWSWWETSKVIDHPYEQIGALVRTKQGREAVPIGDDEYPYAHVFNSVWTVFAYSRVSGVVLITDSFYGLQMRMNARGIIDMGHKTDSPGSESYLEIRQSYPEWSFVEPFLMAIGFSHCKNVGIADAPLPAPKIRARWEKQLKRPVTIFKTLVIDPSLSKSQGRRDGGASTSSNKRLHIARGNFATYTEDKPLFGKYTGTFWRPAHVRGSVDSGVVYKDYRVKAGGGQ